MENQIELSRSQSQRYRDSLISPPPTIKLLQNNVHEIDEIFQQSETRKREFDEFQRVHRTVSVDEAFEICGGFGLFQLVSGFFLTIAMGSIAFVTFGLSYLEARPKYECYNHYSQLWESCQPEKFCDANEDVQWRVNYDDMYSLHNLIEQLDFHCQPDYKIGLFGSFFLFGLVIGCLTLARMADIYGRKNIFLLGMVMQIVLSLFLIYSKSFALDYFILMLLGWAFTGKQFAGYSFLIELQPTKYQAYVGSAAFMFEASSYFYVSAHFRWISKYWHYLFIPVMIFSISGTIVAYYLPESPRFLLSQKKYDQARSVFSVIGKHNLKRQNMARDFVFKDELEEIQSKSSNHLRHRQKQFVIDKSLKELCVQRQLRFNLIFSFIYWSCSIFNWYINMFYLKYFPGSIYLNTIIYACTDFVSYVISANVLRVLDTNKSLFVSFALSALGALLYLIFYWETHLIPIFIVISRLGNTMAYNIGYIANNRLFPTKFLSSSYGLINFVSHLVAIGAPLVAELNEPFPYMIFLINAGIGAFASLFVKEINAQQQQQSHMK